MKTDNLVGVCVTFVICFILYGFSMSTQWENERTDGMRLDRCIKLVNEIGIPASDIEERSNFLQNCYEK